MPLHLKFILIALIISILHITNVYARYIHASDLDPVLLRRQTTFDVRNDKDYEFFSSKVPDIVEDPDAFHITLADRTKMGRLTYQLHWRIERDPALTTNLINDDSTNWWNDDTVLRAAMTLTISNGSQSYMPWIGLGFGTGMLNSWVIVCHGGLNGTTVDTRNNVTQTGLGYMKIHRHDYVDTYRSSLTLPSSAPLQPIAGGVAQDSDDLTRTAFCEWSLPLAKVPPQYLRSKSIVWALNPSSGYNTACGSFFTFHGANEWSRGVGTLIAFIALIFIVTVALRLSHMVHYNIGVFLMLGLALQFVLGILNRLKMAAEYVPPLAFRGLKIFHMVLGLSLVGTSFVQVYYGLRILYPLEENLAPEYWVLYFTIIAGWVIAFAGTELTALRQLHLWRRGYAPRDAFNLLKDSNETKEDRERVRRLMTETQGIVPSAALGVLTRSGSKNSTAGGGAVRTMAWAQVASEVRAGKVLVVADRRYVYDATQWLSSHPGGAGILHTVAGTDISFDFFHKSGFNAEDLIPKTPAAAPTRHSTFFSHLTRRRQTDRTATTTAAAPAPTSAPVSSVLSAHPGDESSVHHILTPTDWRHITRARRHNVHSRDALKRLSHYLVGELRGLDPNASREEYRRYAVTARTVEAPGSGGWTAAGAGPGENASHRRSVVASRTVSRGSVAGGAGPIVRLRLCLIQPTPELLKEPAFVPGQTVEVMARIGNKVVTRFLAPVSGSVAAFEVMLRIKPGGTMSGFLGFMKEGQRQVKVRGPIGNGLLGLKREDGGERDVVCLVGGTGMTAALQILHHQLFPLQHSVAVHTATTSPADLAVQPGDTFIPFRYDFKALHVHGANPATDAYGRVPLSCLRPPTAASRLLFIVSLRSPLDACGVEELAAATKLFPDRVDVVWCVGARQGELDTERGSGGDVEQKRLEAMRSCGTVREGLVDRAIIDEVVGKWRRPNGPSSPRSEKEDTVLPLKSVMELGSLERSPTRAEPVPVNTDADSDRSVGDDKSIEPPLEPPRRTASLAADVDQAQKGLADNGFLVSNGGHEYQVGPDASASATTLRIETSGAAVGDAVPSSPGSLVRSPGGGRFAVMRYMDGPMVVICGPEGYTRAMADAVGASETVRPWGVEVWGGEVGLLA
ncbi:hypothetical protein HDU96_003495 [Phlyctochytrium bullatum]|nr:hypothetical protein HDU96_003495 [Phlyctochytrium bullatum]